jgi:cell wall-associated NlpC family hydrolase
MSVFDKRLTAARPDLAAAHLRGQVEALAFVTGQAMHLREGLADLRQAPNPEAPIDSQVLHGENLTLYEDDEGWGWVQLERDRYVGYVAMRALDAGHARPTHKVNINRSFLYPGPNIKFPILEALPRHAALEIVARDGDFSRTKDRGFIFSAHLAPVAEIAGDFVSIAEKYLHAPYLWGGNSSGGIDCSGLVQIALEAGGIMAPRDTDLQEQALGDPLVIGEDLEGLQRGDLVFWKGHVGIMRDAKTILHANAFHMLVASEPLAEARDRIFAKSSLLIASVRRLHPKIT